MDLNAYLLDGIFQATASRGETQQAAQIRRSAIAALFAAHAPADAMEATIAANCVTLQFLLNAAVKDSFDSAADPARQTKLRAQAVTIGRALAQWQRQLEKRHAPAKPVAKPVAKTGAEPARPEPPPKPRPTTPRPVRDPGFPTHPTATLTSRAALHATMPAYPNGHPMGHATG